MRNIGIVAAAMLLTVGCGPTKPAGPPAAGPVPAAGAVRLVDFGDNDGPSSTVILTGAIGDFGDAVTVDANGTVDPEHGANLELRLAHGVFRINVAALDRAVVDAFAHFPADPATCSGSIAVTADTPIVAGSGTGSYQGISGTFQLTATIAEVDAKPVCDGTGRYLRQFIVIDGTGQITT